MLLSYLQKITSSNLRIFLKLYLVTVRVTLSAFCEVNKNYKKNLVKRYKGLLLKQANAFVVF